MGEDDVKLVAVGDSLAALLLAHGMTPDSAVLDVGCGYGRLAIGLLHGTDHRGPYLGFDILRRHITWCRDTVSPVFPTVRFRLLDVRNDRYNPKGTIDAARVSFPTRSGQTDVCAVFSVFTHLFRPDIERYLGEIHRVLRPGGVAVTTWFLLDDARLAAAISPAAMYPMIHELDAETRYADEQDPLRAIAYREDAVRAMIKAARLEIGVIERGTWAGEPGDNLQDLVILRRSPSDTHIDAEPDAGLAGRTAVLRRRALAVGRRGRDRTRRVIGRVVRRGRRVVSRG
jgi:SAM-dependent methyltransferase